MKCPADMFVLGVKVSHKLKRELPPNNSFCCSHRATGGPDSHANRHIFNCTGQTRTRSDRNESAAALAVS